MEREDFIIEVYLLVCQHYGEFVQVVNRGKGIRPSEFAPALSDEEVITIEVCGAYFKQHSDSDTFDYFVTHFASWFPALRDRVAFVRQSAALWQVKAFIWQRLVQRSGAGDDPVQAIDTVPLPVCERVRGRRDRCFVNEAQYGYCATKEMHYYGFKLGLRIARCGMITHFPLLAARPPDLQHLQTLVEGFQGIVPADKGFADKGFADKGFADKGFADKGFLDASRQALLQEEGVVLVIRPRKNSKTPSPHPWELQKVCAQWRKRIETVGSQLVQHFDITRIRVRDLWHLQHRLLRKILAHIIAVFFNLQRNRPPLQIEDLVAH